MLATMPEVQKLSGLRPAIGLKIPNPSHAIPKHQPFLRTRQTSSERLPMQPTTQFRRLTLAAHHHFFREHRPTPLSSSRLLVQVKHSILNFVPFYALFAGLFLSPTRTPKSRKPTVDHEQRQL